MEVCQFTTSKTAVVRVEPEEAAIVAAAAADKPVMKKKKKTSYKALMSTMMTSSQSSCHKTEKEQVALQQGLGGGQFRKIEKI
jgi:hypothetical protein